MKWPLAQGVVTLFSWEKLQRSPGREPQLRNKRMLRKQQVDG